MGNFEKKIIDLNTVNSLKYESLDDIQVSVFEDVYRKADKIMANIVDENHKFCREDGKDDHIANIIAFLGERGRGKSSAMLSFYLYLNHLKSAEKNDWSIFRGEKYQKLQFVSLPYIDAAMLAQNEFLIDVVLARMWDGFEDHMKKCPSGSRGGNYDYYVREVKAGFTNVRSAYIGLREKERETGNKLGDKDAPVAGALRELSVSMNLRREIEKLVENYLAALCFKEHCLTDGYLVIAIDDIDMADKSAFHILEQIRRFLNIPNVIILLTADISRLKTVCESYYVETYKTGRGLPRFVNDYLEKVLPWNMRNYMPELKENHSGFQISKEQLKVPGTERDGLKEKDIILGYIAEKSGIYFDPERRRRHFLQNESLRGMAGYFDRLLEMDTANYISWLKQDLRERVLEKIGNENQKEFVEGLFSRDYEDINNLVINYIHRHLRGEKNLNVSDKSLGQVLYACGLMEEENAENIEFVNCILMFYSIMLCQADDELKKKIIGNSLWGEWEDGVVNGETGNSERLLGFDKRSRLTLKASEKISNLLRENKLTDALEQILDDNILQIEAWLLALMFVNMDVDENVRINTNRNEDGTIYMDLGNVSGKRGVFGFVYQEEQKYIKQTEHLLTAMLRSLYHILGQFIEPSVQTKDELSQNAQKFAGEKAGAIMEKMGVTADDTRETALIPLKNVEILYSLGKVIGSENISDVTDMQKGEYMFQMMELQYRNVQRELKKRDEYYAAILNTSPGFAEMFGERLQAKLWQRTSEMSEDFRKALTDKLGELLVGRSTLVWKNDR